MGLMTPPPPGSLLKTKVEPAKPIKKKVPGEAKPPVKAKADLEDRAPDEISDMAAGEALE